MRTANFWYLTSKASKPESAWGYLSNCIDYFEENMLIDKDKDDKDFVR